MSARRTPRTTDRDPRQTTDPDLEQTTDPDLEQMTDPELRQTTDPDLEQTTDPELRQTTDHDIRQRRDEGNRRDQQGSLTRRQMIVASAGAIAASSVLADEGVAATIVQAATGGPKFFTKDEFTLVDELTELIIPTDEHSPGARAAGCAAYIDARLAEAFDDEPRTLWRDGLKAIDTLSQSMNGHPFLQASEAERTAMLTKIAAAEQAPNTPEEKFFVELKSRTVHAYYTSEIGIHKEMEYKGNTMLQEFAGTDVSKR